MQWFFGARAFPAFNVPMVGLQSYVLVFDLKAEVYWSNLLHSIGLVLDAGG